MKKALTLNNSGIEEFAIWELKQLGLANVIPLNGGVEFSHSSFEELFKFCYLSLSTSKVLSLIGSFSCKKLDIDSLVKGVKELDFSEWLNSDTSLAVRSDIDPLDTTRRDLESQIGGLIVDATSCKVNLSKPDVLVFVTVLGDTCYVGVDLCGVDLAKRDYRVYFGRENIKAPLASYAFWKAGVKDGAIVVDPFCRNGMVSIEGAHLCMRRSVHFFEKDKFLFDRMPKFKNIDFDEFFSSIDEEASKELSLKIYAVDENFQHVSSAKKNAKIAGVEKQLSFSRTGSEWLDTKFKEGEVNAIVSFVPQVNKGSTQKQVEKQIRELFYQGSYILSKEGKIVVITRDTDILDKFAGQYKFEQKEIQAVSQGAETFFIALYMKQ